MRKTRLFPTLVLFGASLTGASAAVATVATVSLTASGCGDDTTSVAAADLSIGHYFDIGVPLIPDMSTPNDLTNGD